MNLNFAKDKLFEDFYVNRVALGLRPDPLARQSYLTDRKQKVILVNNDNGEEGDLETLESNY